MSALLFFNPENDLALASGDAHYTPPASALAMARDLQLFPCLWASADDFILLRDGQVASSLPPWGESEGGLGRVVASSVAAIAHRFTSVRPWGWSPLVLRQLRDAGVPERLLPTDAQMKAYRIWSSRQTAVRLLARLRHEWPEAFLVGDSVWCESEADVAAAHERFGRLMLKAPWSGSGRGIRPVPEGLKEKDMEWVRRTLRMQGGVEAEPLYERVQDLALEFWVEGGRVRYEGLSVFSTTAGGVYSGNMIASEAEKEAFLNANLNENDNDNLNDNADPPHRGLDPRPNPNPLSLLAEVRERLTALLSSADIPDWYSGPLGVDMMVVKADAPCAGAPVFKLHPLVEVNLRATMGWVALQLSRRRKSENPGYFQIVHRDGHYGYIIIKSSHNLQDSR